MDNKKFRQIQSLTPKDNPPTRQELDTIWAILEEIVEDATVPAPQRRL